MTERQLPLFIKIKEFLIKELNFNIYDKIKIENTSVIAINNQKARNNSKGSILLIIKNVNLLYNYLIPYLDGLEFITKKYKDYQDFKVLVKVVYYGGNKDKEIKSIILKLSYNMNNYRLSNKVIHQAESSIYKILNPKEEIFIVQTLTEAANIVGVNIKTLSNKLNKEVLDSDEPMVNIKNFKVKRIGVFIGIN